ncbi:MAG: hypothetical protein VYA84_19890 [Planctomycetota bacterium]|nr:hypothetical protein [Planctomycetota bacterium]
MAIKRVRHLAFWRDECYQATPIAQSLEEQKTPLGDAPTSVHVEARAKGFSQSRTDAFG